MKKQIIVLQKLSNKVFSLFFYLLFVWGCKHSVNFAYLKYDSAAVNAMLRSDATHFIVQPYTASGDDAAKPFGLVSYTINPGKPPRGSRSMAPDILEAEMDSTATFAGEIIGGNNVISRAAIIAAITDDSNKPLPFTYIRLRPFLNKNNYLAYELFAVHGADTTSQFSKERPHSDPCPPIPCQ